MNVVRLQVQPRQRAGERTFTNVIRQLCELAAGGIQFSEPRQTRERGGKVGDGVVIDAQFFKRFHLAHASRECCDRVVVEE